MDPNEQNNTMKYDKDAKYKDIMNKYEQMKLLRQALHLQEEYLEQQHQELLYLLQQPQQQQQHQTQQRQQQCERKNPIRRHRSGFSVRQYYEWRRRQNMAQFVYMLFNRANYVQRNRK